MEEKSRTSRVREIVLEALSDGMPHTYEELKNAIRETEPELLSSSNMLSTVLSRLVKTDPHIFRPQKLIYQRDKDIGAGESVALLKEEQPAMESMAATGRKRVESIRFMLADMEQRFRSVSCEVSEREFAESKKLYLLSKEMQAVIAKYY